MPPPGNSKKKNKNKDKKAKKKAGGGPGGGGGGGSSSIHSLIESGNEHLAHERLEEGLEDLRRAANLAPDSADAVEAYGMALAEFGDPADAIAALKRAAQGYEKFMYLGQLLDDGVAAATCTRQGLALIEFQAAHGDEEAEERMAGACCALTEQLLATAEDVEDVADECEGLLRRAAEADPSSAEPLQVMASLRSQQGRAEEALEALRQSIAQWRSRRGGRDVDPDDARRRMADEEDNEFLGEYDVSFEFRFETAKLLLELDENTDEAIDVLEELLEERDDVVDVWHLLALANHGCCNFDRALELLGQAEQLNEQQGGDENVAADLMELRSAVEDSKARWKEDVGVDHRMGGADDDSD